MMTTNDPIHQAMQFLTDPEETVSPRRDPDPFDDSILADAEAEEMYQLWAADPGNQGA